MLAKGETLPTGKVTLLFTDSRVRRDCSKLMGEALAKCWLRITLWLRDVWSAHAGSRSRRTVTRFCALHEAQDAADAALAAQPDRTFVALAGRRRVRVADGFAHRATRVHERERDFGVSMSISLHA